MNGCQVASAWPPGVGGEMRKRYKLKRSSFSQVSNSLWYIWDDLLNKIVVKVYVNRDIARKILAILNMKGK